MGPNNLYCCFRTFRMAFEGFLFSVRVTQRRQQRQLKKEQRTHISKKNLKVSFEKSLWNLEKTLKARWIHAHTSSVVWSCAHAQNRINSVGSDRYGLLFRHPVVRPHQHGIAYNAGMRVRHSFSFRPNFRAHILCKALSIKWALLMSSGTWIAPRYGWK